MEKLKLGILGAADIAFRRFLPALSGIENVEYVGVAVANKQEHEDAEDAVLETRCEKAAKFKESFGGRIYVGYEELLKDASIDAVYIPLPPSLHFTWAKKAMEYGKHVFLEKPCTTDLKDTQALIGIATCNELALSENYAFIYHRQLQKIRELLDEGRIGELRLIRVAFGFPMRAANDFRYSKRMGGGALLDCGGYVLKVAQQFAGEQVQVLASSMHRGKKFDVDMFGSVMLSDAQGIDIQASYGMDNAYKCELELWGTQGSILAPRIFTPPADLCAQIIVKRQTEQIVSVEADDQFAHAIEKFIEAIQSSPKRKTERDNILRQAVLVNKVREKSGLRDE